MKFLTTTIGSYPRPRWFREYLKEIEGLQKEGHDIKIDMGVYKKALKEVIENQKKAKIDLLTDGQLIWHDFLAYLATKIDGFKMNGLTRYFDNNVYYRIPIAKKELKRKKSIIEEEILVASEFEKNIKAVLSCFTLAKLSKNEYYSKDEDLIFALAEIMHEEAKVLSKITEYIQLDEPYLLYAKQHEIETAIQALEEIIKGVNAKFFLVTYFKDAKSVYPYLLELNVEVLGLDFVEGFEKNIESLKEYGIDNKSLQIGIIDGRNTKIEEISDIESKISRILDVISPKEIYLSPNTGLEFLPSVKAYEKLKLLGRIKKNE